MMGPDKCPALQFVDAALADYQSGPIHRREKVGDGAIIQISIGPLCVNKSAMAGEIAQALADDANSCQGVCVGGVGCAIIESAVALAVEDKLSDVPRRPDYA